jgi:hypothetical protein
VYEVSVASDSREAEKEPVRHFKNIAFNTRPQNGRLPFDVGLEGLANERNQLR